MNVSNGKLWRTKELLSEFDVEGSTTKNTHLSCLLLCHPHQVAVIQVVPPSVCVCARVCGKGVATHIELVCETQLRRESAEAE